MVGNRMEWLVCVLALGSSGCDLIFELHGPTTAPDADVTPQSCTTKMSALVDRFTEATLGVGWNTVINPALANMEATTGMGLALNGHGNIGAITVAHDVGFDLLDERLVAAIDLDTVVGPNSFVELRAIGSDALPPADDGIAWRITNDQLVPGLVVGGDFSPIAGGAQDNRVAQRFIGFERHDNTTTWITSMDGQSFDPVFESQNAPLRFVRPSVTASFGPVDAGFIPTFTINETTSRSGVCSIETLREGFDDPVVWGDRGVPVRCEQAVVDGALELRPNGLDFRCDRATSGIYDVIGSIVTIETSDFSGVANGVLTFAELVAIDGSRAILQHDSGMDKLVLSVEQAGIVSELLTVDYDFALHRFWRYVGTVDASNRQAIEWQVSGDGVDFTPLREFGGLTGFERARLRIGANGFPSDSVIRFAAVNPGS